MWANSVWGLLGFSVTFGIAGLLLTSDQIWLLPYLLGVAISCGVLSALVLFWPLRHKCNRDKVREALKHPRRWITKSVEPLHLVISGLVIVVIGVAIAAVGLWRQSRSPATVLTTQTAVPSQRPSMLSGRPVSGLEVVQRLEQLETELDSTKRELKDTKQRLADAQQEASDRKFTNRTIRQLRAIYEGRTRLQADAFMADEKGKLIETQGIVVNVDSGMVFLQNENDFIECRLGPEWNAKLSTLRQGDTVKIRGTIGPSQNGAQIYLQECEILT
jgi:hypothetical protein